MHTRLMRLTGTFLKANGARSFSISRTKIKDPRSCLHHIHIPYIPFSTEGVQHSVWPYSQLCSLQKFIQRQLLNYKATRHPTAELSEGDCSDVRNIDENSEPNPTLITFTTHPVYTFGRRQHDLINDSMYTTHLANDVRVERDDGEQSSKKAPRGRIHLVPDIVTSPRGGLTTYHGPGQLVCWPILDLSSESLRGSVLSKGRTGSLGVRTWVEILEKVTMSVLEGQYGILSFTDPENPGVWVKGPLADASSEQDHDNSIPRKIAALGVHLRRYITSHGVSINLHSPRLPCFPPVNIEKEPWKSKALRFKKKDIIRMKWDPWARFIACGIPSRAVTSVSAELNPTPCESNIGVRTRAIRMSLPGPESAIHELEDLASAWAHTLSEMLGLDGVSRVEPRDKGYERDMEYDWTYKSSIRWK